MPLMSAFAGYSAALDETWEGDSLIVCCQKRGEDPRVEDKRHVGETELLKSEGGAAGLTEGGQQ